jgi:sulfur-oxidizing protein SoxA
MNFEEFPPWEEDVEKGDKLFHTAFGQTSHFPVYRKKWKSLGTLQRRYGGCNKQVRAKPFKAQGPEYRNLEYFHTAMSNGVPINGPSSRQ